MTPRQANDGNGSSKTPILNYHESLSIAIMRKSSKYSREDCTIGDIQWKCCLDIQAPMNPAGIVFRCPRLE